MQGHSTGGEGAEIVYSLKNDSTLADMALNNIGEAGQIKRKVYQRRLPENPNQDYYYILRETGNTEPILVEYGFIDSPRDAQKLRTNLNNYVEGVVKAIAEYTGYTYYPPGTSTTPGGVNTYTVQKGDTLYKIANRYGISVSEIKRLNNLTSDTLQIGQVLKLSESSSDDSNIGDTTTYIVKKNDTLYGIASKYNTTVDILKRLNNFTTNTLYIGQEIIVPNNNGTPDDDITQPSEYDIYIVKKGDSLWLIANNYGITVDELVSMNNLKNLTLQIGQELKVPATESSDDTDNDKIYIVQRGDTLWSIARENNLSVDELKQLNNLTSNLLSVGQELIIKR